MTSSFFLLITTPIFVFNFNYNCDFYIQIIQVHWNRSKWLIPNVKQNVDNLNMISAPVFNIGTRCRPSFNKIYPQVLRDTHWVWNRWLLNLILGYQMLNRATLCVMLIEKK